ncbi:hypothetical protein ACFQ0M_50120 [Kitasatospora aburaviensis]
MTVRRLVPVLAATCAVAVGNLYFPQAVGPLIAAGLHVSPTRPPPWSPRPRSATPPGSSCWCPR